MATSKPRIPVTLEPELWEQVTAYRLEHGISSQSKAIRQLVRLGLNSPERDERSAPFRERTPAARDSQERELLEIARELDPAQKALLLRILQLAGESAGTRQSQ